MRAPVLIGIAGGTGSGKTTRRRRRSWMPCPPGRRLLLQQDSYYRDRSHLTPAERARINFDEPDAIENDAWSTTCASCARAAPSTPALRLRHATPAARESRRLEPCPIVVAEGILLFAVAAVRDLFDLRIFVETPDDVRLLRRIKRDLVERGRDIASIEAQYLSTVRPMHELHVAPSKRHAHLIVPEGGENSQALDVIVGRLLHLLGP